MIARRTGSADERRDANAAAVADSTGNFADTLAPRWMRPYLRLARIDRPIGSWLVQFNAFAIATGIASLAIVAVYPFMKRITYWPQIVLGLAFSWGALMGWAARFGELGWPALLLYAGAIAWVIGYDTIYAHQDREDDALIGIKSTALLFGERTKPMLSLFYGVAVMLIGTAGMAAGGGAIFMLGCILFGAHLG